MKYFKEMSQEYLSLSEKSENEILSDKFVFQKISELDRKYKDSKLHYESFEGVLSNIGADQQSIPILNCVIKRLKEKKLKLPKNKYNYDFGNTVYVKADIERKGTDDFQYLLTAATKYKEAKNSFLLVQYDEFQHFERATTNISNILEKYGRNYEAIFSYDKALAVNPGTCQPHMDS